MNTDTVVMARITKNLFVSYFIRYLASANLLLCDLPLFGKNPVFHGPPYADTHVRWVGEGKLIIPLYPIRRSFELYLKKLQKEGTE